ncbi:conserved phage protein [Burkholderia phage BcepNazgul]|uniref:Conserved phage protein n=1 Tax=Burkholderia phage BcepNazgul TaxID=242861 RepID=Q6UYH0_9CAUD|nr:conserved phage protein [Burkholderia phage BcepNazgul]AAQ63371.1 conserved phage protein [Burkholderia phage BcepNazgul]
MAREIKFKGKNVVVFTDGTMRIENVRASYPHLAKPYKGDDQEGQEKYSLVGFIEKDLAKSVLEVMKKMRDEMLREKNDGKKIPTDKFFFRDGDASGKDEYEGCYTINASETKRPSVRGADKRLLGEREIENTIYAGCRVNILINPWWQDNKFGKRINANLLAVQFVRDDEPIGEGRISEDEIDDSFDDVSDGEEALAEGYDDNGGL